ARAHGEALPGSPSARPRYLADEHLRPRLFDAAADRDKSSYCWPVLRLQDGAQEFDAGLD
ncbi:hypothetical protein, partial [Streptomyces neyagawaensis]